MCLREASSTGKCEAVIVFETQGPLAYQAQKSLKSEREKPRKAFLFAGLL
jgi:hypothetical protein